MITQVDICNLALSHLGQRAISSLTEPNEQARKCNLIYATTRDAVLRAASWNFATKIEPLAAISDEEILGWDYLYMCPVKCLYIRKIYNEDTIDLAEPQEFRQLLSPTSNQKAIATDVEEAYIEYTYQIVDPNLFDSLFVDAFSTLMASKLAQPLTGDSAMGSKLFNLYASTIDQAKVANANEGKQTRVESSGYLEAR
jgi:hypothetical protein